ncbi:MAG: hypothetical protein OXK79_06055, partial [Chloroflexota bacterium]|nr:hypothetical protein [Chloroflexota bacterium]
FTQEKKIEENIDDYRTGCEVDAETLMTEYKLWEANRLAFLGRPTPTPRPVTDTEVALQVFLERVWEHGCATGRRDVTGAKQTTLLELRDQLNLIDERLTKLEEAEKTTPTATPTP